MKRLFLGSTALVGVTVLAGGSTPAAAEDGVKLVVGGFFKEAYMVVFDDDGEGEFGNERNTDGLFNDAEIHFTGSFVADNGLEYGARIELEAETEGDQIDEAWLWFAGKFGEVRIGSEDEALANACIVPPGGTGNFSAFSPNQWGSNGSSIFGELSGTFSSNSVCTGVDLRGDAQKIVYISPVFAGLQLTASYTPNGARETHDDGVGPHTGMPEHVPTEERHDFSVYGTYQYMGDGWSLTAGLGGSWEGHVEEGQGSGAKIKEQDFYQAGLNLTFGNFAVGVVGEYYNDARDLRVPAIPGFEFKTDTWVVGAGASYMMDAWTFGLQYSHRDDEIEFPLAGIDEMDATQDRIVATVQYALGPGMFIDGELGYTWMDTDPELEDIGPITVDDNYQAFELGIGVNFTF